MQQDIYAAGSENRPPMLNKENYVPWSSRLLRYAKSRPNGKLIHNSIINGPYVRRMIPEPCDTSQDVPVNETFHLQTDDELTKKELKQIEADDQAIQTILLGLPEDIYAAVDSCETAQEIWLRVQQMMKGSDIGIQEKKANQNGVDMLLSFIRLRTCTQLITLNSFKLNYSTPTNNNQRISSNPRNRQIAQPGMNMGQDKQMQMVGGNDGNQFRQYAGQNVKNRTGLIGVPGNANLNGNGNMVAARAEGNAAGQNGNQIRCYNCREVGHFARNCTVRPRRKDAAYLQTQLLIAQKEEAGIQLQAEEYDLMAVVADLNEIEEVNANCILMANLQQASTSNEQYTELLEPIPEQHQVPQNDNNVISEVTSVEQSRETLEQHPANFEETRALYDSLYHNLAIEVEKEVAKFVGDFKSLAKEAYESLAKHNALELEIEHLLKAVVSQDIMSVMQKTSVVDTSNLQTELERTKECFENCIIKKENEYAKLRNDWYKKCDECKYDKISYGKAYKDMQQKIERLQAQLGDLKDKSKDTSCVSDACNLLSQKLESKNVKLEFQVLNYVRENAHLKATYKNLFDSIFVSRSQTKTIIASLQNELQTTIYKNAMLRTQLFKKVSDQKDNTSDMSANTKFAKQSIVENLPKVGVNNTKTRRPQPRSNTKNDRVPSASKSSRSKNKGAEVEEHHRNLLLSKNTKHMSSACNNIKLDSKNVISKVVYGMCKQCLISVNHDVCLRNYVNGKTSHGKKHK
nr:hypothetical protein [Tanacetum cinerariifolium]